MRQTQDQLMQKVERGRDASVIRAMVRDSIDKQLINICQSMINHYRQGQIDHDVIIGKLGEMAGLQNLLSDLDSQERQGTAALERIIPDAETK